MSSAKSIDYDQSRAKMRLHGFSRGCKNLRILQVKNVSDKKDVGNTYEMASIKLGEIVIEK